MSKKLVVSVLYLAGSTLDMKTVQTHVPAPKHKPSTETVANYLQGTRLNWNYSENRKLEILARINSIRIDIRKQVAEVSERGKKYVTDAESYNNYKEKKTLYRASCLINTAMKHLSEV